MAGAVGYVHDVDEAPHHHRLALPHVLTLAAAMPEGVRSARSLARVRTEQALARKHAHVPIGHLLELPPALLLRILALLPSPHDVLASSRTCSQLYRICSDSPAFVQALHERTIRLPGWAGAVAMPPVSPSLRTLALARVRPTPMWRLSPADAPWHVALLVTAGLFVGLLAIYLDSNASGRAGRGVRASLLLPLVWFWLLLAASCGFALARAPRRRAACALGATVLAPALCTSVMLLFPSVWLLLALAPLALALLCAAAAACGAVARASRTRGLFAPSHASVASDAALVVALAILPLLLLLGLRADGIWATCPWALVFAAPLIGFACIAVYQLWRHFEVDSAMLHSQRHLLTALGALVLFASTLLAYLRLSGRTSVQWAHAAVPLLVAIGAGLCTSLLSLCRAQHETRAPPHARVAPV